MHHVDNLSGQFLIAMPGLEDPDFTHAVTLICQYGDEGALGLRVNRQADFQLGDVLEQMRIDCKLSTIKSMPVLHGGPVQPERGFVLHDGEHTWEASFRIDDNWAVTTSRDILAATAAGEGPEHIVVALGYAGWSAGQLDEELKANAWLTAPADNRIVFNTPVDERWSAAAGLAGIDVTRLAGYAGHA